MSIYVEIGYKSKEIIDIDDALRKTLYDLKRVGIIDQHKLIAMNSYIIDPGYVHITAEGREYTTELISKLKRKNVYMVGRYARWEYSAMDDSVEQSLSLAKII